MAIVGIVCEYNPLHRGHQKQLLRVRREFGPETVIVCAMSGNFVQRGAPAIVDKTLRARAAVECGADLVVELPVPVCLSSAEGYAAGGVAVLGRLCDTLCFGAETPDKAALMAAARAQLSEDYPPLLREALDTGISFPAARAKALAEMGIGEALLSSPNNILAIEYSKAILRQGLSLEIFPILREGNYHAEVLDTENPSATALRSLMLYSHNWRHCVPGPARALFQTAPLHTLAAGERAVLAKLRTMTEAEFEALPYGSEGLWRKLMHESRRCASLEEVAAAVKSKRYTRSRIDRMLLCAFLGVTKEDLAAAPGYARVLAFTDRGRALLGKVKKEGFFPNAGEPLDHPQEALERRAGDLYGLFCVDSPEPPGAEEARRVWYHRE